MTKKEIKAILKEHGVTMIDKTYFVGEDKKGVLFDTYNTNGILEQYHINFDMKYASCQMYSATMIHKSHDISRWFFKKEEVNA